jgi:hypothetical protein
MPIIVPFPIYGLLFGIHYDVPDADELSDTDNNLHVIQIALGLFGLSVVW